MRTLALTMLALSWIAVIAITTTGHHLSRRRRLAAGKESEQDAMRDDTAMRGAALQVFSFIVVFVFRDRAVDNWRYVASILCCWLALALVWRSVRNLALEFRMHAIVTNHHVLVTNGAYAFVRHPMYLSVLVFLLANGLAWTRWEAIAATVAICCVGTEIRVRAEDALLRRRFGEKFDAYRRRVPSYIPLLR